MNIKKIDFTPQKKSTQIFQNKNLKNNQSSINFGMKQIGKREYADWAVTMIENLLSKPEGFVKEMINTNAQYAVNAAKVKAKFQDFHLNFNGVKDVVDEVEASRKKDLNTIYTELKAGKKPEYTEFDDEVDIPEGEFSSDDNYAAHRHLKFIIEMYNNKPTSNTPSRIIDDGIDHDDATIIWNDMARHS